MAMDFRSLLSSGSQVPYERVMDPASLGIFVDIEQRDTTRLKRYAEHWAMYLGQQWNFKREDGEPLVTINKVMRYIHDGVRWLMENGFMFELPDELQSMIAPELKRVWDEQNNRKIICEQLGTIGGITGDVWVSVLPQSPTREARRVFPDAKSFIRIQVLNSEQCFPIWDPLDTNRLEAIKVVTVFVDPTRPQDASRTPGQINMRRFIQVFREDTITQWVEGESEPEVIPNPLGVIPIVHIRNFGVGTEYYGLSDLDGGFLDLQRELNEKATDTSDTVMYHAHPITVVVGARVSSLERGPKKIWSGFPQGTNVFNLEMHGNISANIAYMDKVEKWMDETGEQVAQTDIPSGTSGVGLEMHLRPILQRVNRKKPYYEKGLQEINYLILRWKEELEGLRLPRGHCKHCGGRIVDVAVKDKNGNIRYRLRADGVREPVTRPKCYHADPWTGDFTEPTDVKVRFVKQFSFGGEIQEVERWRLVAAILNRRGSFWDPLGDVLNDGEVQTQDALKQELRESFKYRDAARKVPFTPEELLFGSTKLPEGSVQVPPEPELVDILANLEGPDGLPLIDPGTGRPMTGVVERLLVPTGCERPEEFNPYLVPVKLNPAMPTDEHRDYQLAAQALTVGLWSRKYAMRRLNIEDPRKMMEEIEADQFVAGMRADHFGMAGDDIPLTELQGMEQQRAAANGGDANQPMPDSFPTLGRNQGES